MLGISVFPSTLCPLQNHGTCKATYKYSRHWWKYNAADLKALVERPLGAVLPASFPTFPPFIPLFPPIPESWDLRDVLVRITTIGKMSIVWPQCLLPYIRIIVLIFGISDVFFHFPIWYPSVISLIPIIFTCLSPLFDLSGRPKMPPSTTRLSTRVVIITVIVKLNIVVHIQSEKNLLKEFWHWRRNTSRSLTSSRLLATCDG